MSKTTKKWSAARTSYDFMSDSRRKNGGFFTHEISGGVTPRLKKMHSNRFFRFTRSIYNLLCHISTRAYGTALLCFGILGTLMYFIRLSADTSIATPIVGILFACLSVPLLLVDKPLPIFLQDFKPTDYLFFEFFCMKRHSAMESEKRFPAFVAMIIGFAPAALSYKIPLWQIAVAIGAVVFIYIGLQSPEFIFLTSLVCLPFIRFLPHSDLVFALAILLALVSFIRKVIYGRRIFFIEQYDIIIALMMMCILASGIFVKGEESLFGSIKIILVAVAYLLAGNIITNRRLAELSANSIILSGVITSLVSVVQFILVMSRVGKAVTADDLSSILARLDGVAALLMVSTVFAVGMAGQGGRARGLFVLFSTLCVIALVLSGEFFAVSALVLGMGAYAVIKSNRAPGLILPVLLAATVLLLFLPTGVLNFLFEYSPSVVSSEILFDIWNKSAGLIVDHPFFGIGIGTESFAQEMASMGLVGYPDSSNLFIELALEAGIIAPIFFLLLIMTRMRHCSIQYLYVRNSQMERMANLSGAALFCMLAFGMVNYIWSDTSAYYLFWCVFGIGSASLRVAKRDYDDRVIYYEESSAHDSSVIDIEIG